MHCYKVIESPGSDGPTACICSTEGSGDPSDESTHAAGSRHLRRLPFLSLTRLGYCTGRFVKISVVSMRMELLWRPTKGGEGSPRKARGGRWLSSQNREFDCYELCFAWNVRAARGLTSLSRSLYILLSQSTSKQPNILKPPNNIP